MALIMTVWVATSGKFTRLSRLFTYRCFLYFSRQNPLKTAFYILFFLLVGPSLFGQQFYIRGEVKDESGNPLQNVSILLHATGYVYHTGSYGSFGILTSRNGDTLSFWL